MQDFIDKHEKHILGTLSGFDRVRFRGTFRVLAVARLLLTWLNHQSVLIKDFGAFAESLTLRLQAAVEQVARECLRARGCSMSDRGGRPSVISHANTILNVCSTEKTGSRFSEHGIRESQRNLISGQTRTRRKLARRLAG